MAEIIRVLHTEWSDGWGGQEIRIINEMMAVRDEGVDVFLACRDDSSIMKKALENNIKVFTLPFRGNADIKTLFSLSKIIKAHSIDIVNTHSGKDTWVGGLAAKFNGVRFIRTRHLSNRINPARTNFINELADYIFTTGESVRLDMIKYNRIKSHKIQSIPTGINYSNFNPDNFKLEDSRKYFKFQDDEIVIGILAVLRQFKRHDLFLQAANSLIKKYANKKLVFVIAGDGPQKESIQNLIEKLNLTSNVKMIGYIDNVPEFLNAINILVLSSDSKEGVPQSAMQGLFMNKPLVATNSGSTKDLLFENNFQLVEKGNLNSLIKGISFYLDKSDKVSTRAFMMDNFSSEVMVKKIMIAYKKILN